MAFLVLQNREPKGIEPAILQLPDSSTMSCPAAQQAQNSWLSLLNRKTVGKGQWAVTGSVHTPTTSREGAEGMASMWSCLQHHKAWIIPVSSPKSGRPQRRGKRSRATGSKKQSPFPQRLFLHHHWHWGHRIVFRSHKSKR